MKRFVLLFALAVTVYTLNAQDYCPSTLNLRIPHRSGVGSANHLDLDLVLYNTSQNLSGFYVEISKDILAQWIIVDEENVYIILPNDAEFDQFVFVANETVPAVVLPGGE